MIVVVIVLIWNRFSILYSSYYSKKNIHESVASYCERDKSHGSRTSINYTGVDVGILLLVWNQGVRIAGRVFTALVFAEIFRLGSKMTQEYSLGY